MLATSRNLPSEICLCCAKTWCLYQFAELTSPLLLFARVAPCPLPSGRILAVLVAAHFSAVSQALHDVRRQILLYVRSFRVLLFAAFRCCGTLLYRS